MAQADGDHKVAIQKCEAASGDAQKACKDQADAKYDLAKANAKAMLAAQKQKLSIRRRLKLILEACAQGARYAGMHHIVRQGRGLILQTRHVLPRAAAAAGRRVLVG